MAFRSTARESVLAVFGSFLFVAAIAACGSAPAPDGGNAEGAPAAAARPPSVDELPDRDISGLDACEALPGAAVAAALSLELVEAVPSPQVCSYTLRDSSGAVSGVQLVLTESLGFIMTRNTSEDATEFPGLGVAAFTKKPTGSQEGIWVARKDGLFFNVRGDRGLTKRVARAAFETIR